MDSRSSEHKKRNIEHFMQLLPSLPSPGLITFMWLLFGILSVYLSWSCKTNANHNTVMRVLFAIGAFFCPGYVPLFLFFKYDTCFA